MAASKVASLFYWRKEATSSGGTVSALTRLDVDDNGPLGAPVVINNSHAWLVRGLDVSPSGNCLVFCGQNEIFHIDLTKRPAIAKAIWHTTTPITHNQTPRYIAIAKGDRVFHTVDVNSYGNKTLGFILGSSLSSNLSLECASALWLFKSYIGERGRFGITVDSEPIKPSPTYTDDCLRIFWGGNDSGVGGLAWITVNPANPNFVPKPPNEPASYSKPGIWVDNSYDALQPRFMNSKTNPGVIFITTAPAGNRVVFGVVLNNKGSESFKEVRSWTFPATSIASFTQAAWVGNQIYLAAPNGLYQADANDNELRPMLIKGTEWDCDYTGEQLATLFY